MNTSSSSSDFEAGVNRASTPIEIQPPNTPLLWFFEKHNIDPTKHCNSCGYNYSTDSYSKIITNINDMSGVHQQGVCECGMLYCVACGIPIIGVVAKEFVNKALWDKCMPCLVDEEQDTFGGAFKKTFYEKYMLED